MPQQPDFDKLFEELQDIKNLLAVMNKYRFAEQYLDNKELCSLFKISNKTAQLLRQSGQLPFAQLGKKIYYRLSDIEVLFEHHFEKPKRPAKKNASKRKRLKASPGNNGWTITV
ncbi:MAG: helix-turn-helix domain-containing protein [Bacteroidia bacterium]